MKSKIEFIEENFKFKECVHFVPFESKDITASTRCFCGEIESQHYGYHENDKKNDTHEDNWTKAKIVVQKPTNAFGRITFKTNDSGGNRYAEYVRLSDEDDLSKLKELMLNYWGLKTEHPPLLCISVIGGAKSFVLEGCKKDAFCKGLIRAAQTTNAWIMTSGLNLGIVSVVSDAIEEAQSYHFETQSTSTKIRCIGVAPWGYTLNRDLLIRKPNSSKAMVEYEIITDIDKSQPVSLNKNHTHYILVDEGIRNSFVNSKSMIFRASLEHLIPKGQKDGGFGIPLVQIIVEGGYNTLIQISESTSFNIPVVVCSGTGRVSDILAKAIRFSGQSKNFHEFTVAQRIELKEMMRNIVDDKLHRVEEGFQMVTSIVRKGLNNISVFDLNLSDDFDKAILYALIKSSTDPVRQLNIAIKFNRIDIVREKLLNRNINIDVDAMPKLMELALLENRPAFVELLIELGLPMNAFVTMEMLGLLYNCSARPDSLVHCLRHFGLPTHIKMKNQAFKHSMNKMICVFQTMLDTEMLSREVVAEPWISLQTVKSLLQRMLGSFDSPMYADFEQFNSNPVSLFPYQELFVWAVLFNRHAMATIFWRHADDAVALGLVGCNLYHGMVTCMPFYDTESRLLLKNQKDNLETMLTKILELCYTKSQEHTTYLLERPSSNWIHYKCMELASQCYCYKVMSSRACQHAVNVEWRSGVDTNPFLLILGVMFPPLILAPCFTFKPPRKAFMTNHVNIPVTLLPKRQWFSSDDPNNKINEKCEKYGNIILPFSLKWLMLRSSPNTKFAMHSFSYVFFLSFFTYTILFGLQPDAINIFEAFLSFYFISFIYDTAREIVKSASRNSSKSFLLKRWINSDKWHPYDIALSLASIVCLLLRIGLSTTFIYVKTMYSLTFIFYFLRIFQVYSANRRLGPELVMIFEMLKELIYFMLILVVFLISYGIAMQAISYPFRSEFTVEALKDAVYYPYFRLYGELFLEETEGLKSSCTEPGNGVDCPIKNCILPILLAFYLLVVSILLINLLIAIFSNVFMRVQNQSLEIWKFTNYSLLVKFKSKTIVPFPLGMLYDVCVLCILPLLRSARRFTCAKDCRHQREDSKSEEEMSNANLDEEQQVIFMQRWAIYNLLKETHDETQQSLPNRVESLQHTIEEVLHVLTAAEDDTSSQHSSIDELHDRIPRRQRMRTGRFKRNIHLDY